MNPLVTPAVVREEPCGVDPYREHGTDAEGEEGTGGVVLPAGGYGGGEEGGRGIGGVNRDVEFSRVDLRGGDGGPRRGGVHRGGGRGGGFLFLLFFLLLFLFFLFLFLFFLFLFLFFLFLFFLFLFFLFLFFLFLFLFFFVLFLFFCFQCRGVRHGHGGMGYSMSVFELGHGDVFYPVGAVCELVVGFLDGTKESGGEEGEGGWRRGPGCGIAGGAVL